MIELAEKRTRLSSFQLRWLLVISAAVVLGLGLVLLFLLTQAADNRELYEQNYRQLFALNVVVATLLMGVIVWMSGRLLVRLRQGRFGSRLLLKIAATFALVGFLPGLLIYSVSYQFVSRSIESWFDVKVEGALDAGLSLGRTTLDTLANDLGQKTRAASSQINDLPDASVGLALERMKDQLGADDVILWSTAGQAISSAGESRYKINPDRPTSSQLRLVKTQSVVTVIDGLDEAELQGTAKARIRVQHKRHNTRSNRRCRRGSAKGIGIIPAKDQRIVNSAIIPQRCADPVGRHRARRRRYQNMRPITGIGFNLARRIRCSNADRAARSVNRAAIAIKVAIACSLKIDRAQSVPPTDQRRLKLRFVACNYKIRCATITVIGNVEILQMIQRCQIV